MLKVRKTINRDEVWCVVRRKWVVLTSEERVRQWFIGVLIEQGIAWNRISVEQSLAVGGRRLRADIIVYDGVMMPEILVECKAPEVTIDDAVFAQAINYNSTLGVKRVIVTNGITTLSKIL